MEKNQSKMDENYRGTHILMGFFPDNVYKPWKSAYDKLMVAFPWHLGPPDSLPSEEMLCKATWQACEKRQTCYAVTSTSHWMYLLPSGHGKSSNSMGLNGDVSGKIIGLGVPDIGNIISKHYQASLELSLYD